MNNKEILINKFNKDGLKESIKVNMEELKKIDSELDIASVIEEEHNNVNIIDNDLKSANEEERR